MDTSLKRMNLDYIDVFYCHAYDYDTPVFETIRAIDDLIKQGKIRYAGVSNWTAAQLEEASAITEHYHFNRIFVNQREYSILNQSIEKDLSRSKRLGISKVVFSPLAQGILTGKYNSGIPVDSRAKNPNINKFFTNLHTQENIKKAIHLENIANESGLTLAEMSLLWVLRENKVASALIGVTKLSQLIQNAKALQKTLPKEAVEKIENMKRLVE